MGSHAMLSPSSAARWLNCSAAPQYEAQFPREESPYAAEGTLAHIFAALCGQEAFKLLEPADFEAQIEANKKSAIYSPEMVTLASSYASYLLEKSLEMRMNADGMDCYSKFENHVDLSAYIPGGYGTVDSILLCGDTLQITDYKYGKGVAVTAERNPQMMLYALGALEKYCTIYGGIKKVNMSIFQPRINSDADEYSMAVDDLRAWGETSVKPVAEKAVNGNGVFKPGEWCRFCRGRAVCKARADQYQHLAGQEADPDKLTLDQIGDLLKMAEGLTEWVSDLKEYSTTAILDGKQVKGWKLVEGRSVRQFADQEKAFETLTAAGIDKAVLYDYAMKSLSEIEKLLGKKSFGELLGDQIVKPAGKPTLAHDDDKRPAYSPAAADFKNI